MSTKNRFSASGTSYIAVQIDKNDPAVIETRAIAKRRGDVGGQPSMLTAMICDSRGNIVAAGGNSAARALVVTPIGRATVLRQQPQVAAQGGCP